MLTQKKLKELLFYSELSGEFFWRKKRCHKATAGKRAGTYDRNGYLVITVDQYRLMAQRLVFLYVDGYLPENNIDHINGIRADNRRCNLRESSQACNLQNSRIAKDNTSGFRGVSWDKSRKKWQSRIHVNGKTIHIGRFSDKLEAAIARIIVEDCLPEWKCDERNENRKKVLQFLKNGGNNHGQ